MTVSKNFFGSIFSSTLIMGLLLLSSASMASGDHEEGGEFNAGSFIIDHIKDSHDLHLWGHISIPLPVILYTENGLVSFMSSEFHHDLKGNVVVEKNGMQFINYEDKIYHVEADETGLNYTINEETGKIANRKPTLDLSITKSVLGMLLMLALVCFIFFRVAKAYKKRDGEAPKGMQNLMESLIVFIRDDIAIPSMGKKYANKFLPFLLTVFFFIWFCNLLGLIPFIGGFNITGTMAVTMVLAAIVFIMTLRNGNKHYYGHIFWPPGVPFLVKLLLIPIEIFGVLLKPLVLMIRLTANISAGHIIILAFCSIIFIMAKSFGAALGIGVGIGATAFMIFMFFIEVLVAFLQAYVFTLLAALYFGDATHEEHH